MDGEGETSNPVSLTMNQELLLSLSMIPETGRGVRFKILKPNQSISIKVLHLNYYFARLILNL